MTMYKNNRSNLTTKRRTILFVLLSILCEALGAQEVVTSSIIRTASSRILSQVREYPQEKLYMQTDKSYYSAGDSVWFRAYLVHASLHIPLNLSHYIYVELIDKDCKVIVRQKIAPVQPSFFCGQIQLSEKMKTGWYTLRAYTRFMRNLKEPYFFHKQIFVGNLLLNRENSKKSSIKTSDKIPSVNVNSTTPELKLDDVQFFPEGGALISGVNQTIAFKALAPDGYSTSVSGRVTDETGTEVAKFSSEYLGMGRFELKAEAGRHYFAICRNKSGEEQKVSLPVVTNKQLSLTLSQDSNQLVFHVLRPEKTPFKDTLYLIAHLRGMPIIQKVIPPGIQTISQSTKGLGTGIVQVLLLNNSLEILSQRLVFLYDEYSMTQLKLDTDRSIYKTRDVVHTKLQLSEQTGASLKGMMSVSITDDKDVKADPFHRSIESYLLLESDLKGEIERPDDYFSPWNDSTSHRLELLMLTQGWNRYDLPSVLAGINEKGANFDVELGTVISGKLNSIFTGRPVANNSVSLYVKGNDVFFASKTKTDKDGSFSFSCPDFPDGTTVRLEAPGKGIKATEIVMNEDSFPEVSCSSTLSSFSLVKDTSISSETRSLLEKSRARWKSENGQLTVILKAVEIVTDKKDKQQTFRLDRGASYFGSNFTLDMKTLQSTNSMMNAFYQIPGFSMQQKPDVKNNAAAYRYLINNKDVVCFVDNSQIETEELMNISIDEVEMIDVLKDPTYTALYNTNSVIVCVYLKRGRMNEVDNSPKASQKIFTPLGCSVPSAFYVPGYSSSSERQDLKPDLRSTIYWNPFVITGAEGKTEFQFSTADSKGPFTVIIEGITTDGRIIRYKGKLNQQE